jgi:hypothetical protein
VPVAASPHSITSWVRMYPELLAKGTAVLTSELASEMIVFISNMSGLCREDAG